MTEIDEDHPIWKAIDLGGGQTCSIRGVLRELDHAGYAIVPKVPTKEMVMAGHEHCRAEPQYSMGSAGRCYRAMIAAARS